MDTTYQVERLSIAFIQQAEAMYNEYYDKTEASTDLPPYDFQWEKFVAADDDDTLLITTARQGDKLVGIALYFFIEHLHHRGLKIAYCDGLSTSMHVRGQGIGKKLYLFTEPLLKERGAHMVINHYRTCYPNKPVFESLGFNVWEHVYMKRIN